MTKKQKVNKTQWVLAQDRALAAHEVVALAKKAGVTLTAAQVYVIRSLAKKRAEAQTVLSKPLSPETRRRMDGIVSRMRDQVKRAKEGGTDADPSKQFVQLCIRAGIDNSQRWLDELREGVA